MKIDHVVALRVLCNLFSMAETQHRIEPTIKEVPEDTDGIDVRFQRSGSHLERQDSRLERMDSQMEAPVFRRKRADSLSVVTVDTADLDCTFTRPDEEREDKIIEEEKSETGRVFFNLLFATLLLLTVIYDENARCTI